MTVLDARSRQVALAQLRALRVHVFPAPNGTVRGRVLIRPHFLAGHDVVELPSEHRFIAVSSQSIRFVDGSPFENLGVIELAEISRRGDAETALEQLWGQWFAVQRAALERARHLTPDAGFCTSPWRIQGGLVHRFESVQVLFSPDGALAVVVGIAGRPVHVPPVEPRVLLPVHRCEGFDELVDRAVEQARRYAPEPEDLGLATSASIDLCSQDLKLRYGS